MKISCKWLKNTLALEIKKLNSFFLMLKLVKIPLFYDFFHN